MSHAIRRFTLAVSILVLLTLGVFGCQQNSPPPSLSDPFTNSMSFFTLTGYSSGYSSGGKYNFDLTLNNTTKEMWQSKYSAYLIDTTGVKLSIVKQRPFTIQPETSLSSSFEMKLPEDIQTGAYGLMLVFPGLGTSITTLHVGQDIAPKGMPARLGDKSPPSTGPWPDLNDLPQL
jgi:hypothetical protein